MREQRFKCTEGHRVSLVPVRKTLGGPRRCKRCGGRLTVEPDEEPHCGTCGWVDDSAPQPRRERDVPRYRR